LANLAVLVGLPGVETCFVATINDADLPTRFWWIRRQLWRRITLFVTSTQFVRDKLRTRGIRAEIVKHGAVRDLGAELAAPVVASKPHRVLFWRDPSITNGADICLATFRELAPKFPHISFDAAVRNNHWANWTPKLQALAALHPNIHVHVFPYTDGTSLAQLLAESICLLLPFRELSYHPQLSVLESIQFGAPVITTALASNVELADAGRNALLVPVADVEATIASIEKVLKSPEWAQVFAKQAAQNARAVWNWDNYVPNIIRRYTEAIARTRGRLIYPDSSVH
jgi:hypothetical protein